MQSRFRSVRHSFLGFMKLIRFPNLIIIAFTQYLTTIFLIGKDNDWKLYLFDPNLILIVISTLFVAAAGYIINDYYDIKIDYLNRPQRVVIGRFLKRREALLVHSLFNAIGIFAGTLVSWKIGLLNIIAAFLLWSYSNYFKRLPFVGNLIIAVLTGLALIIVGIHFNRNFNLVLIYAIYAIAVNLIREIIKDMEDWQGDATFGCKTLPILWGIRKTKLFLYILIVVFTILLFFLAYPLNMQVLNVYFLFLTIPIIIFWRKLYLADTKREFGILSTYCKVFMLSGVLSMLFFKI